MKRKASLMYFLNTPLSAQLLIVLLGVVVFTHAFLGNQSSLATADSQDKHPLLLSTGLLEAQEAELRIILWFEKGKPQENFLNQLPQEDWVWQESHPANSMSRGYSLAGYTRISQESEQAIFSWYQGLVQDVGQAGGIAYLDERVPEGMDIAQYALQQNILPRQFSLSESVSSVAGWQESFLPKVVAGNDKVNIQVISQGYGQGRTALAIPVLLEEF
ncbi:hypothetical protein [Desulfitobacterium chlororespirans]|uniref:TATA-box binding n=1 Tax=Desulfitobacterium chlororespirans DSM 11544 TaxID=1121395 RepID=A0A1M7TCV4_9FIRM|nr:hypothetical protein [Desulfitobacterium chlororespirans]SHN68488.1 hypothetical protein SAMN02745215_01789 [Desulfitobacterium chlororespirans DSM 11544]